ncbi:MAG: polyketide synthase of type I, partial [bacterium]|nr:polyketide synthase of type I [bacterium]
MKKAQSYQGQAVQVQIIDNTIAVVTMVDKASKNMFSDELVLGLHKHLFEVQQNKNIKAVILSGYDNIFCMGGSQESLVDIAERRRNFTDVPFLYRGLLELEVPVITAMQGHALGGGLLFGLYGDIVLMSNTGVYSANFMKYGFTPGMGATYILGEKLGKNLATEMMYTAKMFEGEQLKTRGASVIVCDQNEVLKEALQIARQLVKKPRQALTVLKKELSGRILKELLPHIEEEVEMHAETFGTERVKEEIEAHFEKVKGSHPQKVSLKGVGEANRPAVTQPATDQARKIKLTTPLSYEMTDVVQQQAIGPLKKDKPLPVGQTSGPVKGRLKSILQRILHLEVSEIDDQTVFQELGVDSIGGVEIIRDVNKSFGLNLEAVTFYDQYNLEKLSRFIEKELVHVNQTLINSRSDKPEVRNGVDDVAREEEQGYFAQSDSLPAEVLEWLATDDETQPKITDKTGNIAGATDIAIIGLSGRFPGADDAASFWENLANGVDGISQVPPHKWDLAHYYDPDPQMPGKSYSQWLGSLADEDKFDAGFFNISPREAERMDVQQRLFLEEAWKALEDAAYSPQILSETNCTIYVGVGQGDYHSNFRGDETLDAHVFMGSAPSILTARLAYHLNLKGASIAIDTACSSSLVAIHKACQSLMSGESELALAGGIYVGTTPEMHIMTSKAMMLAPDGRCKTFDDRADGFVIGEGVGVVVLKKLEQAILDGDQIYGVIKGSGINQDGKTNGITAPSVESQQLLETHVYEQAGIDPSSITLVEAHGTGTKLGDPIEVRALTNAFRKYTAKQGYCALGSVKTNIGHTLTAAGVAGVIKVLLALKHKKLPPSLHFERPNEHIDFENSPFYVNTELKDWDVKSGPRRAAVSSFGFSGTNAHLVIEEAPANAEGKMMNDEFLPIHHSSFIVPHYLVVLSARNEERLREYVARMLVYLEVNPDVLLTEMAYTLQVGREAMASRLAFVVTDLTSLREKLIAYLSSEENVEQCYQGQVKQDKESINLFSNDEDSRAMVQQWLVKGKLEKLAAAWVKGLEIEWPLLYGVEKPSRISLPTYPFTRERYWVQTNETMNNETMNNETMNNEQGFGPHSIGYSLHPLVQRNISTLTEQCFSSIFTGAEFFLNDHRVRSEKVLP